QYQGLLTPAVLAAKADEEAKLVAKTPPTDVFPKSEGAAHALPAAIQRIADAQAKLNSFEREYGLLETGHAFFSELFTIARHLTRLSAEMPKASGDRLREYRDSNLESLKFQLFSPAPIHAELERAKLAASLTFLAEQLGGEHPLVVKVLAGKNPAARAVELVAGTKLADVAERKRLADGGRPAVEASTDPMLRLARDI